MGKNAIASVFLGLLFISCGVSWLAGNIFGLDINFNYVWPLFLLGPGLFMWVTYFMNGRKEWGIVIPATIMTSLGFTFLFNTFVAEQLNYGTIWAITAFMYTGSVALAFWLAWLASGRKFGVMLVAVILSVITLFIFCSSTLVLLLGDERLGPANQLFWPFVAICAGVFILMGPVIAVITKDEDASWENWGKKIEKDMEEVGEHIERAFDKDKVEEAEIVDDEAESEQ